MDTTALHILAIVLIANSTSKTCTRFARRSRPTAS